MWTIYVEWSWNQLSVLSSHTGPCQVGVNLIVDLHQCKMPIAARKHNHRVQCTTNQAGVVITNGQTLLQRLSYKKRHFPLPFKGLYLEWLASWFNSIQENGHYGYYLKKRHFILPTCIGWLVVPGRWHNGSAFVFCSCGCTFESEPSPTSAHACGEVTGCAPAVKRLASVAPEVNLGECTLHSPPQKKSE